MILSLADIFRMGETMRKWLLAAMACAVALSTPVAAQQRTINEGANAAMLRTWPIHGVWQVALARSKFGGYNCLLMTGVTNPNSGEVYFWGFRQRGNLFALVIADRNKEATAGSDIAVVVDGTRIGTFPISMRDEENGGRSILAELQPDTATKITKLLSVAGSVKFVTKNATYSAALQGLQQSGDSWRACLEQAALM